MNNFLKNIKKNYIYGLMALLLIVAIVLVGYLYKQNQEYSRAVNNNYNYAFYELITYVGNVEKYLAKASISSSPAHGADTLTNVWREANLASAYLSQLPTSSEEFSKTSKFLNQVGDYSFSLSRKNMNGESLSSKDLEKIKKLYEYCIELNNTLEQLALDIQDGRVSWEELSKDVPVPFAQQVGNLSSLSFSNIDQNFGEYEGLIYDGAFSEHIDKAEKKGLTGDDITEASARNIAIDFIGKDRVEEITSNGFIENGNIQVYTFAVKIKNGDNKNPMTISVSKKGGHIVLMAYNREIKAEIITEDTAKNIGLEFLSAKNINDMKPTYYMKQGGAVTINYAYEQDNVIIYPDLIELKIALDNGEILGLEMTGYLNSHYKRNIKKPKISPNEAKKYLNKNLKITRYRLAIIPTKWKTEIFCYEFTGKIDDTDFLVYINADTGKEENILVIINTPNGSLTQ